VAKTQFLCSGGEWMRMDWVRRRNFKKSERTRRKELKKWFLEDVLY